VCAFTEDSCHIHPCAGALSWAKTAIIATDTHAAGSGRGVCRLADDALEWIIRGSMGTDIYLFAEEQRVDQWHFLGTMEPNEYPMKGHLP